MSLSSYVSPIEEIIAKRLKELELPFVRELPFGRYRFDFAFPEIKLAVELDGITYHRSLKQRRRDWRKNSRAYGRDWDIMRFSSWEVFNQTDKVVLAIEASFHKKQLLNLPPNIKS